MCIWRVENYRLCVQLDCNKDYFGAKLICHLMDNRFRKTVFHHEGQNWKGWCQKLELKTTKITWNSQIDQNTDDCSSDLDTLVLSLSRSNSRNWSLSPADSWQQQGQTMMPLLYMPPVIYVSVTLRRSSKLSKPNYRWAQSHVNINVTLSRENADKALLLVFFHIYSIIASESRSTFVCGFILNCTKSW